MHLWKPLFQPPCQCALHNQSVRVWKRKGWPAGSIKPTPHPPQSGRSKVCTASPSWHMPAGLKSCNIDPHLKADRGCLCWRGRHSHICSLFSLPLFITPPLPNIPMLVFSPSHAQIYICSEAQKKYQHIHSLSLYCNTHKAISSCSHIHWNVLSGVLVICYTSTLLGCVKQGWHGFCPK